MLYRHMLLLTWITPTGAKGIVTLDLLNCNEVQSVPSPTHVLAKDDIGTIAAIRQSENARRGGPGVLPGDLGLMEMLTPFHLMYSDGIERLAAESPRERLQWTSAIMSVFCCCIHICRSDVFAGMYWPFPFLLTARRRALSGQCGLTPVLIPPAQHRA